MRSEYWLRFPFSVDVVSPARMTHRGIMALQHPKAIQGTLSQVLANCFVCRPWTFTALVASIRAVAGGCLCWKSLEKHFLHKSEPEIDSGRNEPMSVSNPLAAKKPLKSWFMERVVPMHIFPTLFRQLLLDLFCFVPLRNAQRTSRAITVLTDGVAEKGVVKSLLRCASGYCTGVWGNVDPPLQVWRSFYTRVWKRLQAAVLLLQKKSLNYFGTAALHLISMTASGLNILKRKINVGLSERTESI